MDPREIIDCLQLQPHPEGGWYRQTYRSDFACPTDRGPRSACTGIYYLLEADDISAFHRVASDEMWHFYSGDPLSLILLGDEGLQTVTLGGDVAAGQQPQALVPAGVWQAARLVDRGRFVLVGCTVSPGFEFEDFELADRDELTKRFADHADLIKALTRCDGT